MYADKIQVYYLKCVMFLIFSCKYVCKICINFSLRFRTMQLVCLEREISLKTKQKGNSVVFKNTCLLRKLPFMIIRRLQYVNRIFIKQLFTVTVKVCTWVSGKISGIAQ